MSMTLLRSGLRNGAIHWQSHFLSTRMKKTHKWTMMMATIMAKEMREATSRTIGHKKRKKKMIMRIGVALIIVIQNAHLVRRTS